MKMKRFLALLLLATLVMTSFTACSKKKSKENTGDTTGKPATTNAPNNGSLSSYISLGGYFRNDNVSMNIYLTTEGWKISGISSKGADSPLVILAGDLTHKEGTELVYSKNNDEVSFVFAEKAMTVTVNKGTTYSDFAGTYKRIAEETAEKESVSPKSGSTLELLGRVALTHYVTKCDGIEAASVIISEINLDSASMVKFLIAYADLFLVNDADIYPEISDKHLTVALTKDQVTAILSAATDGAFSVDKLDVSGSDIVIKDGTYYLPCFGAYAGGIATRYTEADPAEIPAQLVLDAGVNKIDGTNYYMDMTLSTVTKDGIVHLDSVSYKIKK